MKKTTGLGRGLDALIDTHIITDGSSSINEVELDLISANPDQPRHFFDEEALKELSDSIRNHGVISPITLRKNDDGTYMIIAGERRYRATMLLIEQGYTIERVPALFSSKTLTEENALIQQLLRNEGKPFSEYELGVAYKKFVDMGLSHKEIAEKLGIPRWKVDCFLAHLNRDERVQQLMKDGKIIGMFFAGIPSADIDEYISGEVTKIIIIAIPKCSVWHGYTR